MKQEIFCTILAFVAIGVTSALECGRSEIPPYGSNNKIIGGREARPNSWPWVARYGATNRVFGVTAPRQFCGATIVSERWIVTAAHCIVPTAKDPFVRVGLHNQSAPEEEEPVSRKHYVSRTILHPQYQLRNSVDNDIALLELMEPIEFRKEASTVCLPKSGSTPAAGRRCVAAGWGVTVQQNASDPPIIPTPPMSDVLKQTYVPIIEQQECNGTARHNGSILTGMICAGEFGQDICQSDSGGPLMCENDNGAYELVGVVSWGSGCGDARLPGVYADVGAYMPWITEVTGIRSSSDSARLETVVICVFSFFLFPLMFSVLFKSDRY